MLSSKNNSPKTIIMYIVQSGYIITVTLLTYSTTETIVTALSVATMARGAG